MFSIANLKIGRRLALGFAVVLLFLIASTSFGILRLQATANAMRHMMEVPLAKERLISDWYDLIHTGITRATAIAKSGDPTLANHFFAAEDARAAKEAADLVARMKTMPTGKEETALFDSITGIQQRYAEARAQVTKAQEVDTAAEAEAVFQKDFLPAAKDYESHIQQFLQLQRQNINEEAREVETATARSRNMLIVLAVLVVAFGMAFAWWLTRGITRPLNRAVLVAHRVAAGDLTTHLGGEHGTNTQDEAGLLLHALRDMNGNLLHIVEDVRNGMEAISTASAQIAAGNLDLSARTEQQASALEQTASSIEELTSTVKQNAEHAREANHMAATAADVAVKGGRVVSQVVATMGSINDSSKRIVDIISVIDGIAFQTNILALNAAVEAARAGEQGRGFAVVATEVRALAQRSAAAAQEIKQLIDSSVEKVDAGSKLVTEAGATMDEIVASIGRVNDIMSEITSASQEQSDGIEQIGKAITQMDNVTQQNAALVEEDAAAAQSMQDRAAALMRVVDKFKLPTSHTVAALPVSAAVAKAIGQ